MQEKRLFHKKSWLSLAGLDALALYAAVFLTDFAIAQISVSPSGQASYGTAIPVPPGISGMSPNLSLSYVDGGTNGPVGVGWSVQGISLITRCPSTKAVDSNPRAVDFTESDRLCLDGQRLIQTDDQGRVITSQVDDAKGMSNGWREYRTEKDTYARIRAYGSAGGNGNFSYGPSYFKVWTKAGQIYEYGTLAGTLDPQAQITAQMIVNGVPRTPVAVWAVSRISDVVGNYIDFKYSQSRVNWGSGVVAAGDEGSEWVLKEVQYTGSNGQAPYNKVIFNYISRPTNPAPGHDRAEAYQFSQKNVSTQLLTEVKTYVNSPNPNVLGAATGAVAVRTLKIDYERSLSSGKSRVSKITDCAGEGGVKCLPATRFGYTDAGSAAFQRNATFGDAANGLRNMQLTDPAGNYGVLTGDFNGDGRTDVLNWSTSGQNTLWRSTGGGNFESAPVLSGEILFTTDGCYSSIVADFNGDGLSDILRTAPPSCTGKTSVLFISNGNGSFTPRALPANIDFTQKKPKTTLPVTKNCVYQRSRTSTAFLATTAYPAVDDYGPRLALPPERSQKTVVDVDSACTPGSRTIGNRYYVLDVDGDGLLDILTTIAPDYNDYYPPDPKPTDAGLCADRVCTRVFLGESGGGFHEAPVADTVHFSLYSDPPTNTTANPYWRRPSQADIDGDGLQDIIATYTGIWRSLGNGNFRPSASQAVDNSQLCGAPIDFNGDGRMDCLSPDANVGSQNLTVSYGASSSGALAQFNLKAGGDNLYAADRSGRQTVGLSVDDYNGDGRQDILRWGPTPSDNGIYLSRGDGSFGARDAAGLNSIGRPLQSADGSTSYVLGDFLGTGAVQILHLKANPPSSGGDENSTNQLYARQMPFGGPPDLLATVQSPTGLMSTVGNRVSLVNAGDRYIPERNTGQAATAPLVDLQVPMYVITSLTQQTDAENLTTQYQYKGLKAERGGRGLLGFHELRQQSPAPNGEVLTVRSEFLLQHPYDGVTARTRTVLGGFDAVDGALPLSTTTNLYCDQTSSTPPDQIGMDTPCLFGAKVKRPYLRQSVEQGIDLSGTQLPTVTTTNTYNDFGDPLNIVARTDATFLNSAQTYTKTTNNTFCAPNSAGCPNVTSGDQWVLGRLTRSAVINTVPDLTGVLTASSGTSPTALATKGTVPAGSTPLINPAVLSAILQLLLED